MAITPEQAERRLRTETPYFAEKCLKIVNKRDELVPLILNEPQQEVDRRLEAQHAAGLPMRAYILKARRLGMSTYIEAKVSHRYMQRPNHKAVVVAHDLKTSKALFEMSETMYQQLPNRTVGGLQLKPGVVASRRGQEIKLGEESRLARRAGDVGINSSLLVDTAGEVQAGRGLGYGSMHLSELAHYPDEQKLTALLSSVADEIGTMIVGETTANGFNFFRKRWKQAEQNEGEFGDYEAIFFPWFVDRSYTMPFASEEERSRFEATIGEHEFGADEPDLLEMIAAYWEGRPNPPDPYAQLRWRRRTIVNRFGGDMRMWGQEFPATPDEAFLSTGNQVFSTTLVAKVLERAEKLSPSQGLLQGAEYETRQVRSKEVEVPTQALWTPREDLHTAPVAQPWWRHWDEPRHGNHKDFPGYDPHAEFEAPGQYIVAVDPSSDEEIASGQIDYHGIQVIDHASRKQVAEYRSRLDPDQIALQALLAGLYWNTAWIAVEKTGGYGLSIINALLRVYRYPKIYARKPADERGERQKRQLGWDTTAVTKPWLIDHAKELLRTGVDGIRSALLADEMTTFVRDDQGRTGAEADAYDDLLMPWMVAQVVANQMPLRTFKPARKTPPRRVLSRQGGY